MSGPSRRVVMLAGALLGLAPSSADAAGGLAADIDKNGLYLPWLDGLRGRLGEPGGDQILAQALAMVGDEAGAFRTYPFDRNTPRQDMSGWEARPALDAIAAAARGRRVVMLNEAHHASRCRMFAEQVAIRLRDEGFTIFAAEDFGSDAPQAGGYLIDGPVTTQSGFYQRDPCYAEMVRSVRRLGYRLVAYEQTGAQRDKDGDDPAGREPDEAANLTQVLKSNPDSKVLVYCGFSHLMKKPPNSWPTVMALRFRELTGIDPLSISQTEGLPPPQPALESPMLRAVLDRFDPRQPIVVADAKGEPAPPSYHGAIDMAVYHPRVAPIDGRPGWLAAAPGRVKVAFDLPRRRSDEALVQAVRVDEARKADNVVPSDQYLVGRDAKAALFFLKPGRYAVRLETLGVRTELGELQI